MQLTLVFHEKPGNPRGEDRKMLGCKSQLHRQIPEKDAPEEALAVIVVVTEILMVDVLRPTA
jgi:hypothetical protein